ncbi:MAG: gliding motility-associated C-terminal domain-containing protein [Bacteroidetes bacterium]|nr:MAG: gliding motility-associated C-terminal domain-containing protein [Bacteroidota bacterium]
MMNAAGDLTFRNDSLFLAAFFNNIVLVDIETPMNSQIYFTYPDTLPDIYGISTFFFGCDSLVSFGAGADDQFYLIDFGTNEITPTGCTTPTSVYGLATIDEWQTSDCKLRIDLDGDDSSALSGPMPEDGFYAVICGPDFTPPADTDMVIVSDYFIDSVTVEVLPHPDTDQDSLGTVGQIPGIHYAFPIPGKKMVLSNAGSATTTDFEEALQQSFLTQSGIYSPGLWEIQIIAWANNGTVSDTAIANILRLPGPQTFSLGGDTTLCNGTELTLALPQNLAYQIDTFTFGTITWQDGSHNPFFTATTSGSYFADFSWEEAPGCTWSDTIEVNFADTVLTQNALTQCEGESFIFNGQAFYTDTLLCTTTVGFSGCDSTHCINLTFLPVGLTLLDSTICQGQTVFFNGQQINTAGIFADTLTGANGCDSILLLDLAILPPDTTHIDTTICQGSTLIFAGQTFSLPGEYLLPFTSQDGCDSLAELRLSVSPPDTTLLPVNICEGESFQVGGQSFATQGMHEVLLTSQLTGCDSLILLDLTLTPVAEIQTDTLICEGESILFGGQMLYQSGIFTDTLTGTTGCDSVVTLNLAVLPVPAVSISVQTDTCGGIAQLTAQPTGTDLVWSNGEMQNAIKITLSDNYSVTVTDANGCSASADTTIMLTPPLTASLDITNPRCHDTADGSIEIADLQGGRAPFLFFLDGMPSDTPVFAPLPAGNYVVSVQDDYGCEWSSGALLPSPPPFELDAGDNQTIAPGQSVLLSATASSPPDTVWWLPPDYLNCPTCPETEATPTENITYRLFALDTNGCPGTDTIAIIVQSSGVYIPNAFSPNGDGINDLFTAYGKHLHIESLKIFNRWGGIVWNTQGDVPWDGTANGQPAQEGVYVFLLEYTHTNTGEVNVISGDVLLIR